MQVSADGLPVLDHEGMKDMISRAYAVADEEDEEAGDGGSGKAANPGEALVSACMYTTFWYTHHGMYTSIVCLLYGVRGRARAMLRKGCEWRTGTPAPHW